MAWTSLVGTGLSLYLRNRTKHLSDLDFWTRNTAQVQLTQLRRILNVAANTEYGKSHDFAKIAALPTRELLSAYRKTVPVRDISAFRPQIERMRSGAEPDVLWPGVVKNYAQTSGTTAGDKYIPVSDAMMNSNFRSALDIFAHAQRFGISLAHIMAGKCVFLGGSTNLETNAHGIKTGDLSGIVTPLIKWPLTQIYLPGKEIALLSHWPSKIDAMAKVCLNADVRMISGMASWALVLIEKVVELARAEGRSVKTIADLWPNWTLFVHGGVKYTPFEPRVRAAWSGSSTGPDVPNRLELYPASEGFIAMQDTKADPGLRLQADVFNFYEFVPLERIDDVDPPAYMAHEVQKGVRYVVTMTTCAGLYRYVIGDVVEFDTIPMAPDFDHMITGDLTTSSGPSGTNGFGPLRMRIVGRHRHFINAFGENLIVENIETAAAQAAQAAGMLIYEFTASPVYPTPTTKAGLELLVELSQAPTSDQLKTLGEAFDQSLKQQCVDYGIKRTDGFGMDKPTITPLKPGTVHAWMASRGKLGGQHKVPRCANHRDFADAIKSFSQNHPS
jgi:hypothetical protein